MSSIYRVLFVGDVVGRVGRRVLAVGLPDLVREHSPLFVIVNVENSAAGVGITPAIAEEFFELGVDAITLGNHAFKKREIYPYLDGPWPIVRPANMAPGVPGRGSALLDKAGVRLLVANLCGRVYMDAYDDPFRAVDLVLAEAEGAHAVVDFHAEATSEKVAMAYYLDGRATAVLGTHTHVTTADERVLPGGTAAITDVGMTGPVGGVLGMDRDIVLRRFLSGLPERFEVSDKPGVISGVVIDVVKDTGRAKAIRRVSNAEPEDGQR